MDTPQNQVSWLCRFPQDIWAYFVYYLSGEQLGRLMMTGAALLSQRLKSSNVVTSINLGKDSVIFKSFPRFLKEFPSLRELSIHSCNQKWSVSLGLSIDLLPSGLRKLELSGSWDSSSNTKLFGEPEVSLMTSVVRKFELAGYGEKRATDLLGESCQTLTLSKHLPHLEHLDLLELRLPHYSWMSSIPPNLTILKIAFWNGAGELPSSLIHFEAGDLVIAKSTKLPPALESFTARVQRGVEFLVPLLPPSISKLCLGMNQHYSKLSPPKIFLEQLPTRLTYLTVPRTDWEGTSFEENPELISLLPPTLTWLQIYPILPFSAWPLLPQQLRTLAFYLPSKIASDIPFGTLPKSITSLELSSSKVQFFGAPLPSNHSYYPPQLTKLKMRDIQLSPEMTKLLPSSLTHLEIGNFSERFCEHLPSGLRTLISTRTMVSPNLRQCLPKSLTSIHLSSSRLDNPWFDYDTGKKVDNIENLPEYEIHIQLISSSRTS